MELLRIVLPYAPMVCLVALLGAVLQVRGRFAHGGSSHFECGVGRWCSHGTRWRPTGQDALCGLGGFGRRVLQVAWSLAVLGDQPFAKPNRDAWDEAKLLAKRAVPVGMGLSVLQVNILTDTLLASWPALFGATIFGFAYPLEEGAEHCASLASRLYQFPLGVFGIAVATAAFPRLSQTKDQAQEFQDTLRTALGMALFVGLPASVGLCVVATPMVRAVFEGGLFSESDAPRVARLLWTYGPGIWAMSCVHVLVRACYAKGDRRGPVRIGMVVVGTNLLLNLILIWTPLEEAAWSDHVRGLCDSVRVVVPPAGGSLCRSCRHRGFDGHHAAMHFGRLGCSVTPWIRARHRDHWGHRARWPPVILLRKSGRLGPKARNGVLDSKRPVWTAAHSTIAPPCTMGCRCHQHPR